ncbi:MAG: hypothetical protein ACI8W3_002099 [Myxococcota bacterium]|jgi:hypothetical protein
MFMTVIEIKVVISLVLDLTRKRARRGGPIAHVNCKVLARDSVFAAAVLNELVEHLDEVSLGACALELLDHLSALKR